MTIDLAKDILKHPTDYFPSEIDEANAFAVETMRKYQKIEHILDKWTNEDSVGMSDYWMGKIKEVLEDGKTD